jgi:hypothetical protein
MLHYEFSHRILRSPVQLAAQQHQRWNAMDEGLLQQAALYVLQAILMLPATIV